MKQLSISEVELLCLNLVPVLIEYGYGEPSKPLKVFPLSSKDLPGLYALASETFIEIENNVDKAEAYFSVLTDRIMLEENCDKYPGLIPLYLINVSEDKSAIPLGDISSYDELLMPWETPKTSGFNIEQALKHLEGTNTLREGLVETPKRVAKAWEKWTSGYKQDAGEVLKVFEDGAEGYDEMVVVRDIPIYSKCEHHLADIFGTATIAYIPNGKVVGLSKLSRLADIYARRLQVQERLTVQIADALDKHLKPKGVGVVIKARHMCMESRGICQQGHHTVTSALRGVIKEQPETRAEFMTIVNSEV